MTLYWATLDTNPPHASLWERETPEEVRQEAFDRHNQEIKSITAVEADPVCGPCPHRDFCMGNRWNEHGGPTDKGDITSVHTCSLCAEKVLSAYTDDAEDRMVPDECRRWRPDFGSACECNGCMQERQELDRLHPSYEARMGAVRHFMQALLVEKEERSADIRKVAREMAQATTPMAHLPITGNFTPASKALGVIMGLVLSHKVLHEAWDALEDWRQVEAKYKWLEALHLSLGRHKSDLGKVLHEFRFALTDVVTIRRVWYTIPPQERKAMMRLWEQRLRAGLGKESPLPES